MADKHLDTEQHEHNSDDDESSSTDSSDSEFDDIELNPTQEFEETYLYASLKAIRDLYTSYDDEESGKWMMFFHKKILDDKWNLCCDLYKAGKLVGIKEMSVSTNYENPITEDHTRGVIKFYCGPINDESSIMEYGRTLLENVPYKAPMFYKSNLQSQRGTRATGQEINHLYKIIPLSDFLFPKDVVELSPTKEYEKLHLQASLKAIRDLYTSYENDQTGKWMMFFNEDILDEKWEICCNLYRAGKLFGIKEMRVSTNYYKPIAIDKKDGVIEFFCGPANDKDLVMEYGRKLVKVVSYHGKFPIYYRSYQQSRTGGTGGTRGTRGNQMNHLYKIYQNESLSLSSKKNYPESDTRFENWRSKP